MCRARNAGTLWSQYGLFAHSGLTRNGLLCLWTSFKIRLLGPASDTQILADGQCYDVASQVSLLLFSHNFSCFSENQGQFLGLTQGYCTPGDTLVPTSLKTAKCGEDACLAFVPPEDLMFSPESQEFPELYPVFNFTFRGECFFTETQAFCAPGNIARFILPYKIPVCVPPFTKRCGSWEDTGFGTIGTLPVVCKTGSAANFERSLCVPLPLVIFWKGWDYEWLVLD